MSTPTTTTTTTTTAPAEAMASAATNTIAPFDTALNGVDQVGNMLFKDMLWWMLGIEAAIVLVVTTVRLAQAKLRQLNTMHLAEDRQLYWKVKQWSWMPSLNKNLLYAPLFKKRHNREIRLSNAVNIGTLPSRLHSLLLLAYLASNLTYMFVVDWSNPNKYSLCAEIRGRSGTLALVNMIPLVILAGRNNLLIPLLQISFDTYNLFHRWMGRVVVIEAAIHMLAWLIVQIAAGGWESVWDKIFHDRFCASGAAGTLCMCFIAVLSVSPVRHAFYETFLNTHITLAFIAFVATWIHCASAALPGGLPQLPWIIAVMLLWLVERLARMLRLVYCNCSSQGYTEALVEPLPGNNCRVTMNLPRFVDVRPGSHAYLRFSAVSPWENHPFSIAQVVHSYRKDMLPTDEKSIDKFRKPLSTSVSFVIGAHSGFTRKLYNTATASGQPTVQMRAAFEGPYGGHHPLDSYGSLVLIAGGNGITHQLSYLEHLINGYNQRTVATRRLALVWVVREYSALEAIRPFIDRVLSLRNRKKILRVKVFVTKPKTSGDIVSASSTVEIFSGRPDIESLLTKEVSDQVGAMCVTVCGPGSLADNVRDAVRKLQGPTVVELFEESFTW